MPVNQQNKPTKSIKLQRDQRSSTLSIEEKMNESSSEESSYQIESMCKEIR